MGQNNNLKDNEQEFSEVMKEYHLRNSINLEWGKYKENRI